MDDKSFHVRIPKRWVRIAMIVGVTALIVAPLTAIASHSFTDVPDSNIFHADIEWLADAGVTKGCNPPANTEFCPKDSVTREAMSAFMRRFAKYIDAEDGTPGLADDANMLGGQSPAVYENPTAASYRSFGFATGIVGIGFAFTDPEPVATFEIDAPAGSAVALSYHLAFSYSGTATALVALPAVDDPTCGVGAQLTDGTAYSYVDSTVDFATASGNFVVDVTEGAHTFTLCATAESGDVNVITAGIQGTFSHDATIVTATGGTASDGSGFGTK